MEVSQDTSFVCIHHVASFERYASTQVKSYGMASIQSKWSKVVLRCGGCEGHPHQTMNPS